LKFGYTALRWGWKNLSFSSIVDSISRSGFKGLDIISGSGVWGSRGELLPFGGDKNKVLDVLCEKEIKLVSIFNFGNYIRGVDYNFWGIPRHFWWRWWQIPKIVKFANSVGCKKLILTGGYPYFKRKEEMEERDYQKMATLLNQIGKICYDYGVQASYHPHPEPHPYVIQTRDQIDKLFELINTDLVNLALDTGLSVGGTDLIELIQDYRDRINHVHFKDYKDGNFTDLGEGVINFPLIVKTLRSIGYDDWIIIEDWYPPITSRTPSESAKNSKKYVEKYLAVPGDTF
jgi:sugar phosphate isomerase/epimerase